MDVALLMIRLIVGLTLVLHGWNHAFGGGKIPGTARWFESLGLRPGRLHAWLSAATEIGCRRDDLAIHLARQRIGGRPRQQQCGDAALFNAGVDRDELVHAIGVSRS